MLISIICPMYNEESAIPSFFKEIKKVMDDIGETYEIICINDGSTDSTLNSLRTIKKANQNLRIINFSRNFGKEAALTAGLDCSKGDIVIPIDADLQDPPELIKELLYKHQEGFDVVLAKRTDRTSDSLLKRATANAFYKVHNKISSVKIPSNVGDCRLMTRKVVETIKTLPEQQRFMKGLFAWVGYNTAVVEYTRDKRVSGETKFSGWKLWNFAIEGITDFSTLPLKIWTYIGLIISMASFTYGLIIIGQTVIFGIVVPGYASLVTIILFLGGVQLIGIGIIGEYLGRIYMESKHRPIYVVDSEE